MKKYGVVLGVTLCLLFIPKADAHILDANNNVGAVLHIDPNDDPPAKAPATFFFEFKDKTKQLTRDNCDCTVSILEKNDTIFSQSLFKNISELALTNAAFTFTFPQKDQYIVKVVGKPINNVFTPFTLTWHLDIDEEADTSSKQLVPNWWQLHKPQLIGLGIILLFAFLTLGRKLLVSKKAA